MTLSPKVEKKVAPLAPLEIRTTQNVGLQVPLGHVMTELRSNVNQALVMDEKTGNVVLSAQGAVSGATADDSSMLDTTIAGISMFA